MNVIIKFYERVSQQNLNFIIERLSIQAFNSKSITKIGFNLSIYKTVEDYLNQSYKEKNEYMMLSGGLELQKFIN